MKLKTSRHSKSVILEMEAWDSALPPIAVPELRLKSILVAVDFSQSSRKALRYGVGLAKQFSAEIILLHVLETPPPQVQILESALMDTSLHQAAADELAEWRREAESPGRIKAVLREGAPAHHGVVSAAEEGNVDLIIVGNHGRTGLARVFIGSTAEMVVRHAHCPVLVIREQEHDFID